MAVINSLIAVHKVLPDLPGAQGKGDDHNASSLVFITTQYILKNRDKFTKKELEKKLQKLPEDLRTPIQKVNDGITDYDDRVLKLSLLG